YPHSDTTWPQAPEALFAALGGVPDAEVRKITYENACRHFRFDPFSKRDLAKCTAGALRAEAKHVDLALRSKGGKPPAPADVPFVTIGHVMKQLASAFATPFESGATPSAGAVAMEEAKRRWDRN